MTPEETRALITEGDGWLTADDVYRHATSALDTIRRLTRALEASHPAPDGDDMSVAEFMEAIGYYNGVPSQEPVPRLTDVVDPIREAHSEAQEHVECPRLCELCGETLARTRCSNCGGGGQLPGYNGTVSECGDCGGAGFIHEDCVEESYSDLAKRPAVEGSPTDEQVDEAIDIMNDPQYEYAAVAMREVLRRFGRAVPPHGEEVPAGVAPQAHANPFDTSVEPVKNQADSFNVAPQDPSGMCDDDHAPAPSEHGDAYTCADLGHEDCDGGHPLHRKPALSGPARIEMMPPSPETSVVWYSVFCRECGIEEGMAHEKDSPMLIEKRDRHNAENHSPAPSPDRGKLIAELREEARIVRQMTERDPDGPGLICRWDPDEELLDRAATALAAPPVDEEALAEVIRSEMSHGAYEMRPGERPYESSARFVARAVSEWWEKQR